MKYTINAERVKELTAKFNRYYKKLTKVGLTATMEIGEPYPKKVDVYTVDEVNHCQHKEGSTVIDVVDVDLVFPEYKLGDYDVCAVIEHGDNNVNLVYTLNETIILPKKFYTAKGCCEHCRTNHRRVKTVILMDNNTQEFKQVGTNCLKEYTGVDEMGIISAYEAVNSFLIQEKDCFLTEFPKERKYRDTFEYLAKCIHIYNENGYNKENQFKANTMNIEPNDTDKHMTEKVIDFFNNITVDELIDNGFGSFAVNVKNAVTQEYCKITSGFVAYAVVLWEKCVKYFEEKAKADAEKETITYYGNIKDKIKDLKVTGRCVACFDTMYGVSKIYRFTDTENHVFVWKTGTDIECKEDGTFTGIVKGTIKEHREYNGEKQTVLTRCNVEVVM